MSCVDLFLTTLSEGGYLVLGNVGHLSESVQKIHAIFKSHRNALKIVRICIIYKSTYILQFLSKKGWKCTLIL